MTTSTKIFLTGATGYIGGSILLRLLEHPGAATFEFTALVRSQERPKFSMKAVLGSLSDMSLLEALASEAGIVISLSGTGVLANDAAGKYLPETHIYDDLDPDQIGSLPYTQQHRPVGIELDSADEQGLLVEKGIQNPHAILLPSLIRASLARGRGGMVGPGQNSWPNVHIDDVADLYLILFSLIRNTPESVAHGREGYYFGENGEYTLYSIGTAIAEAMVLIRKGTNPEPSTFTDIEIQEYFGALGKQFSLRGESFAIYWLEAN